MKSRLPVWPLILAAPVILVGATLVGVAGISAWGSPIMELRLHRVLTGFIVGAGLAGAGVVMQALLRNPLAEPYVLGVSSGAGLGAAVAVYFGWSAAFAWSVPATAFVGGIATLTLVYALAARTGGSIYGLLLSGIIISAVLANLLMLIVSLAPIEGMHSIMWWILGNLQLSATPLVITGGTIVVIALIVLTLLGSQINALTLGREAAHHLGVRTGLMIIVCLGLATLLAATAVALAGLIGFVGLIVPHVARAWVGPDHRKLPVFAAILGGLFLVVCDTLARTLFVPQEIPIGVVTALVGGPFFLTILLRRRKGSWLE
ncbi:MAG: Hemin transport system permease protein HmuU [Verrucomicrobiae bacterium]|nr:Hemin transport system permease protein HmuU [Verrucomicrobiae bacterium]